MEALKINIRERENVAVFDIDGEIRLVDNPELSLLKTVKNYLESGKTNVLFNLKKVEFIDSFGIGEVVASLISIGKKGGQLKLAHVSSRVMLILKYSRLTALIDVYEDEDEAIKSFE